MSAHRRLSATGRFVAGTSLVLVLGISAVTGVSYVAVTRNLEAEVDRSLLQEAHAFAAAVAQDAPESESALVEASRVYLGARTQTGSGIAPLLVVRLVDGRVVSNSDLTIERAWETSDAPSNQGFSTFEYDGTEYRAASWPVLAADDTVLGTFHAALSLDAVRAVRAELGRTLALIGGTVALLGTLLSVAVARAALAPLSRVAATANRVTKTRLTERIAYDGPDDEVGTMVRALNEMLERLEQSFGEQRQFVADASHELRTPLAVIRGHLDLLDREPLPEACAEPVDVLREETRRMQRMVDDLLLLARLDDRSQARAFQPLSVEVLLSEVTARVRSLTTADVTCASSADLWVSGDPDLLEQALVNLAMNSVTAAGPRGHIEIQAAAEADVVRLVVSDDGPGFREADIERVFDRFYRASDQRPQSGGGSGLGLAIARRLVELHGGTIGASNRPAGGAEVTITLPRAEPH